MAITSQTARTELVGNYNLLLKFSTIDRPIIVDPHHIQEFTITQDINSFLPSLRIIIPSGGEEYTHLVPFDKTLKIRVEISQNTDLYEDGNAFDFLVYRRFPRSTNYVFDAECLLDVSNLFERQHIRGFSGTVYETLQEIASEFVLQESSMSKSTNQKEVLAQISPSLLGHYKDLVQANQTNAEFLNYLADNLQGRNGEGAFYAFFANYFGQTYFHFKTLEEMLRGNVMHYLCYGTEALPKEAETSRTTQYYPVWSYDIVDNYKLEGITGLRHNTYRYFDYDEGKMVGDVVGAESFYSLTKRFAIQKSDSKESLNYPLGRSNGFTSNFVGKIKNGLYKKLINLVRIRVTTFGKVNAVPGELVQFYFAQPIDPEHQEDKQYQGIWMIEKVRHSIGDTLMTTFILVRNGVDTSLPNNLLKPISER